MRLYFLAISYRRDSYSFDEKHPILVASDEEYFRSNDWQKLLGDTVENIKKKSFVSMISVRVVYYDILDGGLVDFENTHQYFEGRNLAFFSVNDK